MPAIILTVIGRKGGCGKSTLLTSLAGSLAQSQQNVLVIDLDGQASATRSLFGREHQFDPTATVAALFTQPDTPPDHVIHQSPIENIAALPASNSLDHFMIPHHGQNLGVLYPLLRTISDQYHTILIDTPPNTNAWPTCAALTVSDWALTPIIPDSYGAHSTGDTLRVINEVNKATFLGFVFTMVERNRINIEYKKAIRGKYQADVFRTEITKAVAFKDAVASRLPVTHLIPTPTAAKAINKLVNEIGSRTTRLQRKAA